MQLLQFNLLKVISKLLGWYFMYFENTVIHLASLNDTVAKR